MMILVQCPISIDWCCFPCSKHSQWHKSLLGEAAVGGDDRTVERHLQSGIANFTQATALSEQHKMYDYCPYSVEFTSVVACQPWSAALSLKIGTALLSDCSFVSVRTTQLPLPF